MFSFSFSGQGQGKNLEEKVYVLMMFHAIDTFSFIFKEIILKVKNFFTKFSYVFESENFQNLKMIESKKFSTKLLKAKNISLNFRIQT